MQLIHLNLKGLIAIQPHVFTDQRGLFYESFKQSQFDAAVGEHVEFMQDNHCESKRHVLRGLHYQVQQPQGKLVRVVHGEVFDIAVDIRRSSPTFGQWVGTVLSADNQKQLWIPAGFAHGYLTLSDSAVFLYKTTAYWAPEHERCIRWDDPAIGIQWPETGHLILSAKDQAGLVLADAEVFG